MALALGVAALLAATPPAASASSDRPSPQARAWLLVDAGDRETLAEHRSGDQLAIASATKLMTAQLALTELRLGDRVTASDYNPMAAESLMGLRAGERVSVHDLLYGLLLASGNDAAVTLAEAVSGSVGGFVAEMNAAASALGLDDTSYENPIGFDGPGQHSSARDLVDLTLELRRRPVFRRIVDTPMITLRSGRRPRSVVSRNNLVRTVPWVNGIKTGYTFDADYVLIGSGTRRGVTLVSALLGAPSEAARDDGTLALLRYGFSLYDRRTVVRAGEGLAAPELRYEESTMPLAADRSVRVTVRRGQSVQTQVEAPLEVEGPVRRGDRFGSAVVLVDGEPAGRTALVAARSAPAPSFLDRADAAVPGPRWVAIAAPLALVAAIVIGIAAAIGRHRYRS